MNDPLRRPYHFGVLCEACAPGFSKQGPLRLCTACTAEQTSRDNARVAGVLVGIIAALVLGLLAFLAYFGRGEGNLAAGKSKRFYLLVDLGVKLRVVVGLYQVIGAMSITFAVQLPPFFEGLARLFSVLTLDIITFLDFGCSVEQNNFYGSLLASTIAPILAAVLIFIVHILYIEIRRTTFTAEELDYRRNISWTVFLVLLFLVYPAVSQRILATFNCRLFDDGALALVADPSLSCLTDTYASYRAYAVFMIFMYIICVPASQLYMLYRRREALTRTEAKEDVLDKQPGIDDLVIQVDAREQDTSIERLRLLWRPYKAHYYYFEIVEMMRKLIQVHPYLCGEWEVHPDGVPGGHHDCATLLQQPHPYRTNANNLLSIISMWVIFFITFIALLIKLDDATGNTQGYNIEGLNRLLIALVFVVPSIIVIQLLEEFFALDKLSDVARRTAERFKESSRYWGTKSHFTLGGDASSREQSDTTRGKMNKDVLAVVTPEGGPAAAEIGNSA